MAYFHFPRLTFSGEFQADTSTLNNKADNYNPGQYVDDCGNRKADPDPESWNSEGTGAFRLFDMQAQTICLDFEAEDECGQSLFSSDLFLTSQVERTSAKIVDLDPCFQLASGIWGMRVQLRTLDQVFFTANYRVSSFRDIFFKQTPGRIGSQGAAAKFTSVLTNIVWEKCADASKTLSALKQVADENNGYLSINITTYQYQKTKKKESYEGPDPEHFYEKATYGRACVAIGPWYQGDPLSCVLERRFDADGPFPSKWGFADMGVVEDHVTIDMSTALQLQNEIPIALDQNNLQALKIALLNKAENELGIAGGDIKCLRNPEARLKHGDRIEIEDVTVIGDVDVTTPDLMIKNAGLIDVKLFSEKPEDKAVKKKIATQPLAIIRPFYNSDDKLPIYYTLVVRESFGGLVFRADDFVKRANPAHDKAHRLLFRVSCKQFGYKVGLNFQVAFPNHPVNTGNAKKEEEAQVNKPKEAICRNTSAVFTPNKDKTTTIILHAEDPQKPRKYIDGQVFQLNYWPHSAAERENKHIQDGRVFCKHMLDMLVIHTYSAFPAITNPTWDDLKDILQQYNDLYPVMGHRLFSLADREVFKQHAQLLHFAFARPLEDPTHMPVTRDLSDGKRKSILNWLEKQLAPDTYEPAFDVPRDLVPNGKGYPIQHESSTDLLSSPPDFSIEDMRK